MTPRGPLWPPHFSGKFQGSGIYLTKFTLDLNLWSFYIIIYCGLYPMKNIWGYTKICQALFSTNSAHSHLMFISHGYPTWPQTSFLSLWATFLWGMFRVFNVRKEFHEEAIYYNMQNRPSRDFDKWVENWPSWKYLFQEGQLCVLYYTHNRPYWKYLFE